MLAGTGVAQVCRQREKRLFVWTRRADAKRNPSLKDEIGTEGRLTYDWLARDRQTVRPITCQLLSDSPAGPCPNGFHGRASGEQTPSCCLKSSQNTKC